MSTENDAALRAAEAIRAAINISPHGPFNENAGRAWAEIIRREHAALEAERDEYLRGTLLQAVRADECEDALKSARADAERLAQVMKTIAYEPIGHSEASYREVYDAIVEMARAALTAHAAATKVTP